MRNVYARFVAPLNESMCRISGHIELDTFIGFYHDTPFKAHGEIWILDILIYPDTVKVFIWVAVNILLYTWKQNHSL